MLSSAALAEVRVSYLYTLSNFYGSIPYNWVNLSYDGQRHELYVVDSHERDIRVFNENGMEVFRFGDDGSLGLVLDAAVKKDGSILVLSRKSQAASIVLCNYRGEPLSEIMLKDLPPDFADFAPERLVYRQGRLYLLDATAMRIAVTDDDGLFRQGYDLGALVGVEADQRAGTSISGFSIDLQGNMLFTIPVRFSAYRLTPDGELTGFGKSGSGPGRFGVVGGIVVDDLGYYYVADRLKSAVIVFDRDLRFQTEFGFRGFKPDNLMGPKNLALDAEGRLYVSQLRSRGVSVFKIDHGSPLKGSGT
jgi:sugar lactone lactonase YvrE